MKNKNIPIPQYLDPFIKRESVLFEQLKENLRRSSIQAKNKLENNYLGKFPKEENIDKKVLYIIDLLDILPNLVLFSDNAVLSKLNEIGIGDRITRWMFDFEEINFEIEKLDKFDGLFIFKSSLLFSINTHLILKLIIETVEFFGLDVIHNNSETNIIYKHYYNLLQKYYYVNSQQKNKKYDNVDSSILKFISKVKSEICLENEKVFDKIVLNSLKGKTSFYIDLFDFTFHYGFSKRQTYLELLPLFQKILVDENLLNEEDYKNKKDDYYEGSYEKYKISKIKKMLTRK